MMIVTEKEVTYMLDSFMNFDVGADEPQPDDELASKYQVGVEEQVYSPDEIEAIELAQVAIESDINARVSLLASLERATKAIVGYSVAKWLIVNMGSEGLPMALILSAGINFKNHKNKAIAALIAFGIGSLNLLGVSGDLVKFRQLDRASMKSIEAKYEAYNEIADPKDDKDISVLLIVITATGCLAVVGIIKLIKD